MEKATEHNIQWKKVKLGEVGEIVSGGTPSTSNEAFWDGGVLFVTPLDLGRKKEISSTIRTISELGVNNSSANKIKKNSLAVSTRAPIGLMSIVSEDFTTNQGCKSIQFFENIDSQFFYYYLSYNVELLRRYGQGTTFMEISKTDFANIEISVPSLPAQRRIAAILSAADKVIEQTRQLISKYKSIKQGMMEDLLEPKEGWKKVKWGEYVTLQGGFAFQSKDFVEEGVPLIRIGDITTKGLCIGGAVQLPNCFMEDYKEYALNEDDTVIAMSGATTGKCTIVFQKDLPALLNQRVGRFVIKNNSIDKTFLYYIVGSYTYQQKLILDAIGGAQPNVSPKQIESVLCYIPVLANGTPNILEQRRIAKILSGIDRKIEAEEKVLEKYEKMKKGLMERLLNVQTTAEN